MWLELSIAATGGAAIGVSVLGLMKFELERAWQGARSFKLQFPRGMEPAAVTTFLAGLSGVKHAWSPKWTTPPTVVLEARAVHGHIEHFLLVPRALTGAVLSQLRAALPSVRLEAPEGIGVLSLTGAMELGLTTEHRPLRAELAAGVSAGLLSSLQPLRANEEVVVQWVVTPLRVPKPPRLPRTSGSDSFPRVVTTTGDGYELLPHAEALRAERDKQTELLFGVVGRLAVRAATSSRGRYLLDRMASSYQMASAPGVEVRRRAMMPSNRAVRRTQERTSPLVEWPAVLNAAELSAVIGWPIGLDAVPGMVLGGCRQLAPSAQLPSAGCVVGHATYPGAERPIAIRSEDRTLHLSITGPTGTGKSNLLLNLVTQDMQKGLGVVVVDPKGDLVSECLQRVPKDRSRDVIVIDPGDDDQPVGINLVDAGDANPELAVEHIVHVFHQLFSDSWGPRTDDVMRAGLLTLLKRPGMTLLELPLLLTNKSWRAPFVSAVQDDVVGLKAFWDYYDTLRPGEQSTVIAPLMNKVRATLLRAKVRHCIGQATPRFKLSDALDSGKLIFLPLRQGVLGDEAAQLLGSLFIARIWQTIQARSAVPESERRLVHLYVDEAHAYVNLPTSLGDVLAQARGLRLAVTVATQHLTQWPTELRQDVLANCRSQIVFQTHAQDAAVFAKEFSPYLTADDLQGLGRYEIVARLAVGQRNAPPATAATLPPPPTTNRAKAAVAWSRHAYGVDRDALERAMRERQSGPQQTTPVGRQRRTRSTS